MTVEEAVFLGALQGATEFLPVSSSGHLVLAEYFLGIEEASLAFDVTLHLGTLFAVLAYFRKEWIGMLASLLPGISGTGKDGRLLALVLVATIPGALFGLLLEGLSSTVLRTPWVVVITLGGVALLLFLGERLATHRRTFSDFGWRAAVCIGSAQALAIVPGVSRSGITMTAALLLSFERTAAARFSFLLSAPIIAAAGLYEGLKFWRGSGEALTVCYLWGFLAAAVSGYAVIAFLMRYLARHTFYVFVWYRLVLAAVVAGILVSGAR